MDNIEKFNQLDQNCKDTCDFYSNSFFGCSLRCEVFREKVKLIHLLKEFPNERSK